MGFLGFPWVKVAERRGRSRLRRLNRFVCATATLKVLEAVAKITAGREGINLRPDHYI